MAAQNLAAGKPHRCAKVLAQAVWIVLPAYPLRLLLRPVVYLLFDGAGIDPEQLALQRTCFDIMMWGSIIGLLRHTFG